MFDFMGFGVLPGINTVRETVEASLLWGAWEVNRSYIVPTLIDGSSVDQGSTPTTLLRPGLLMGMVTATKKVKPYATGASDGTEDIYGVLMYAESTQLYGANADKYFGYLLVAGQIKTAATIYDAVASTPGGWIGGGSDTAIRADMDLRFIRDDVGYA